MAKKHLDEEHIRCDTLWLGLYAVNFRTPRVQPAICDSDARVDMPHIVKPNDLVRLVCCRFRRSHGNSLGIWLVAMFCYRFRHVLVASGHLLVPDRVRSLRLISLCIV